MPASTPRGYPYPLPTEPADGSPNIEALARAIDTDMTTVQGYGVRRFASASARDSAIPAPSEGQECWLTDIHQHQAYYGGWKPIGGVMPLFKASLAGGIAPPNQNLSLGDWSAFITKGATFTYGTSGFVNIPITGVWALTLTGLEYSALTTGKRLWTAFKFNGDLAGLAGRGMHQMAPDMTETLAVTVELTAGTKVEANFYSESPSVVISNKARITVAMLNVT